jgi:hypothetical protein
MSLSERLREGVIWLGDRPLVTATEDLMDEAATTIDTQAAEIERLTMERDEARKQYSDHLRHVQEWLCSMYAIMIDPFALDGEAPLEVLEACRQLEAAAVEQQRQWVSSQAAFAGIERRAQSADAEIERLRASLAQYETCMCGGPMDGHEGMGHGPVSMADYHIASLEASLNEAVDLLDWINEGLVAGYEHGRIISHARDFISKHGSSPA